MHEPHRVLFQLEDANGALLVLIGGEITSRFADAEGCRVRVDYTDDTTTYVGYGDNRAAAILNALGSRLSALP